MRAVNLIPGDARRRGSSGSAGIPFYGLVGGLVLVLLATVLLVTTENRVSSRESQLRVTQAAAARWSAVAGRYARDVSLEKQRGVKVSMVTGLAGQRYAWSQLLDQLASALPRTTTLSSLTSSASASAATPTSTTPATTPATASSLTSASPAPSQITLAACAPSQAGVAQTIVNLRRIHGVADVLLSSTTSGSGSSSGGSGAACGDVSFGLTLDFAATPTATAATVAGTTAASTATTGASQ